MALSAYTTSQSISASTSSARATYPASSAQYIEVINPTTAIAFVNSGTSAVTAATTNAVIPPSTARTIERKPDDTNLAVILSTGTGTIYFQPISPPGQ